MFPRLWPQPPGEQRADAKRREDLRGERLPGIDFMERVARAASMTEQGVAPRWGNALLPAKKTRPAVSR